MPNVIASSTNPTLPFGRDAVAEHLDMIVLGATACDPTARRRRAGAGPGPRRARWRAEDLLHDLGVIPITSSDAQGMGRAGETVRRTFGLAAVMRAGRGAEPAPTTTSGCCATWPS